MHIRRLGVDWVASANAAWSALLRHSDANPVFMSWAWVSSLLDTFRAGVEWRILGFYEGDRLVALLPFSLKRSVATIWGRQIAFPGVDWTGADYNDFLCERGFETVVAKEVAHCLEGDNSWVACEFRDVVPNTLIQRVVRSMGDEALLIEDIPGSVCPRTSLSQGWHGLLRDRFERKRRYNIERQLRLANQRHGLRLVFHETPEAVSRAFPLLLYLHEQRKAAQGIKSAFSRPSRAKFHALAAVRLAESGAAFIVTLESGAETVSAAYCFRDASTVYYFQTGMSQAGATIGAGSTLLYMLLRWAADQGYQWFDFLKGDEDYKEPWATDRVEQRIIKVTRTNWRGQCHAALGGARRALAALYRQNT